MQYDMSGYQPPQSVHAHKGPTAEDIFASFFGGMQEDTFGEVGFRMPGFIPGMGNKTRFQYSSEATVSLADTLQDQQQKITVQGRKPCIKCKTSGKTGTSRCGKCAGNGCEECGGLGATFHICDACQGAGFKVESIEATVQIPKGIAHNAKVTTIVQGIGTVVTTVKVTIPEGAQVGAEGRLIQEVLVSYPTAVLGGAYKLKTLEGVEIVVKIPPLKNGQMVKIKGKGVYAGVGARERGDLFLKPRVDIPEKLSDECKTLIQELARITAKE
jgi:DnaJ-class molecular chaperone